MIVSLTDSKLKHASCRMESIFDLLQSLSSNDKSCLPPTLFKILDLTAESGQVSLATQQVRAMVSGWLGGNTMLPKVEEQSLLYCRNKFTGAATAFNPLRASRPLPKPKVDPVEFVKSFMNRTGGDSCDFCHFSERTAADVFGRLESDLAATSANIFKFHPAHSLVFPKRHDLLTLTLKEFQEIFGLAEKWARRQNGLHRSRTHMHMIFDSLDHAGASQAHPHLHMAMGEGQYLGEFWRLHRAAEDYGKSYVKDFVQAHLDLGLGVIFGNVAIISPLDARKDHELMVVANDADCRELFSADWIKAVHAVIRYGSLKNYSKHDTLI